MTQPKTSKEISRRSFLKLAGLTLGTSLSLAACEIMRQEEQMTLELDLRRLNLEPSSSIPGPEDLPPPGELGFFTQEEALAVTALTATLLPGTPDDPGAQEAGVMAYIDALLWYDRGFGTRTYYRAPFAMAYEGEAPPNDVEAADTEILWIPKDMMSRFGWQSILTPRELYRMGIVLINDYAQTNYGAPYAELTEEQQEETMTALADDQLDPIGDLPSSEFFKLLRQHTMEGMFCDPAYRGNRDMLGWKLVGYPGAQRAYTPVDIQDEAYFTKREPQSLAMLHPFNPGEPSHPDAILPVSGSGTPGVGESIPHNDP